MVGGVTDKTLSLLKQTESRIIVNQNALAMCWEVERNQENQKKSEDNIIKDVRNLSKIKKKMKQFRT